MCVRLRPTLRDMVQLRLLTSACAPSHGGFTPSPGVERRTHTGDITKKVLDTGSRHALAQREVEHTTSDQRRVGRRWRIRQLQRLPQTPCTPAWPSAGEK